MNNNKYKYLIEKLNNIIHDDVVGASVSPTQPSLGRRLSQETIFIKSETDFDKFNKEQLYLAHTLLHKFYAQGGTKELNKEDIKNLHDLIKEKINHSDFDKLDKNDKKN